MKLVWRTWAGSVRNLGRPISDLCVHGFLYVADVSSLSTSPRLLSCPTAVLFLHQQGAHWFLLAAGLQHSFRQRWPLTANVHHYCRHPPPFLLILKRWQLILFAHISFCIHFEGISPNSPSSECQVGQSLVSHGQWRRCKRIEWWDIIDQGWPAYAVRLSHHIIWCSFITTGFS